MPLNSLHGCRLDRRRLLGLTVAGGTCLAVGSKARAMSYPSMASRRLAFYNLHTEEMLSAVYWRDGTYVAQGLADISYHLRDFRSGGIKAIDPHLLDLLYDVVHVCGADEPVNVISGYRSPATNAMLAARSNKVSPTSFHIEGKAIDIRLPGRVTRGVRDIALAIGAGGVGYYPESDFVHLDTGPVRAW